MLMLQPNRYKEHIQNKHAEEAAEAEGGPAAAPDAQVHICAEAPAVANAA